MNMMFLCLMTPNWVKSCIVKLLGNKRPSDSHVIHKRCLIISSIMTILIYMLRTVYSCN